jgi:uncharacterized protein YndB with AHSA1/START domain
MTTSLSISRLIRAPRARVFEAWTSPALLVKWWGPEEVTCPEAHVDLRVGGGYRIANRYANGQIVWISGVFEQVEAPERLVYTWQIDLEAGTLVTLSLFEHPVGTELRLLHERIADPKLRDGHLAGWNGCLDKLDALFAA